MPQQPAPAAGSSMLALCRSNLWAPVFANWGRGINVRSFEPKGCGWVPERRAVGREPPPEAEQQRKRCLT